MLIKPVEEMNLEQLRQTHSALERWIKIEADDAKRSRLRTELQHVSEQMKRRKRR